MKKHIVQDGENIVSVAKLYGISVTDLINANNFGNSFILTPGEELIIPVTIPSGFTYYSVQKGDTLNKIANEHQVTSKQLAELNGLELNEYIFPNQQLIIPKEGTLVYIVEEDDRLNDLAEKLNIPKEELVYYNPNLYLLPNQVIAYRKNSV